MLSDFQGEVIKITDHVPGSLRGMLPWECSHAVKKSKACTPSDCREWPVCRGSSPQLATSGHCLMCIDEPASALASAVAFSDETQTHLVAQTRLSCPQKPQEGKCMLMFKPLHLGWCVRQRSHRTWAFWRLFWNATLESSVLPPTRFCINALSHMGWICG